MTKDRPLDNTAKRVRIDTRMADYEGFYDHQWARIVVQKVSTDPAFDRVISDLIFSLKATSNAFRMPWLTSETHSQFISSFHNTRSPLPLEFVKLIRLRLRDKAKTQESSRAIDDAISEASAMLLRIHSQRLRESANETAENAFSEYIKSPEFQIGIVGLMLNTFASLVFAYEDFVVKCVRLQLSKPELESRRPDQFRQRVIEAFGEPIAEDVWTGGGIRRFFEVRNSLAHRGGRASEKTEEWRNQFEVVDGCVQITATNNRDLFNELRWRIDKLVDCVLVRPTRMDTD